MVRVTILIKWNSMKVVEGKQKLSRLVWTAPGVEFYVVGALKGHLFEQAANLAMNYAEGMHIPASAVRTVKRGHREFSKDPALTTDNGLRMKKLL